MARKKNVPPSYLLHKVIGREPQARVRIAGKEFLLGPYGSEESRVRYGELVAKFASGVPIDPLAAGTNRGTDSNDPGPSIAELIVAFLEHSKSHYIKNGQPTTEQQLIRAAVRPARVIRLDPGQRLWTVGVEGGAEQAGGIGDRSQFGQRFHWTDSPSVPVRGRKRNVAG